MTDEEQKIKAGHLRALMGSPGGEILFKHIDDEIVDGWTKFIELPVDKKTSKAAFAAQAKYLALKGIREWVDSEIKLGQEISTT